MASKQHFRQVSRILRVNPKKLRAQAELAADPEIVSIKSHQADDRPIHRATGADLSRISKSGVRIIRGGLPGTGKRR